MEPFFDWMKSWLHWEEKQAEINEKQIRIPLKSAFIGVLYEEHFTSFCINKQNIARFPRVNNMSINKKF